MSLTVFLEQVELAYLNGFNTLKNSFKKMFNFINNVFIIIYLIKNFLNRRFLIYKILMKQKKYSLVHL